jgi:hypothetical protein
MTLKLNGSSSGYTAINAPAAAGSNTLVLPTTNGSAGQVLQTDGNGNLSWVTPGAGKILQVVNYNSPDAEHESVVAPGSDADTTWLDVGTYHASDTTYLQATITPASASNKVMLSCQIFGEGSDDDDNWTWRIKRAISGGATTYIDANPWGNRPCTFGTVPISYHASDNASTPTIFGCSNYVDSPATTSATTYTIQMRARNNSASWDLNRTQTNSDSVAYEMGVSYITLMEIGA